MLLVLLIGLSCAVATDTSKDISELEVKKQDIDTNINALKESNVDKTVNQKEIIGKTQNTQIDKIKAKETTKNTITKKEPTISSTEKSTKTTDDDTQEASNHDAKSNKKSTNLDNQKSNTDSSTLIPLEDHEEVSYDKNTVSNEVNINPKVTNNIKESTFNLKNIEEPYKNVSSLNQINTNGTFNLTSDTSGQLTLSDGNTTIYGNNHKIIPNNPNQYFVTINAGQKLTLKNIVIDSNPGFFSDWLYRPAIIVNAGGELILDNCTISKTIQAIKSEGNVTILNSNINNNGRIAHGATIEINGNSNVYIENSRLSNNQYCGINVASNQAKVLLNQTALSGSIEMHVYLGNISLYNVTYDGTQITDENKVSNNGIQDTQDKTNKKNIIILEDSMISIDHAQKILNSTTMTINGRLTSGNTYLPNQTLKVYVDDVLIGEVTTNDNGYYTISYTAEEVGNHNIKVTYDGNYKYLPSEAKSSFEVYKIDTNIIINNINDELFDKLANITGTLTNANDEVISNAKVIVTINGNQKILITNSTGGFTYTGAKVLLGDNTVTALFEGTRTYNPSEDTKTFTGKKHDTQITLNPIENTHIDDSIEISGILTDVNGTVLTNKNIIITIDNQQHTITTDDNGKYRITHTITSSGEKTVLVTYDGDTAYNPSSNQTSFNVRKINTTISLDNISDTTIDSTIWISGILKDEFGNILPNTQVSILINTHNITTTTDVNGKYNYSYTTTTLGENRIMVGYIGNDKYSSSYNETSFNVHRINTNLSIDTIDDTTIGSDITIKGVLRDEFGILLADKEIIITINGQEYIINTNADGKYNYIYTTSTLGENIVSVNYPGDNKYSSSSNQTSFNVRKINTNLSIDTIDDTTIESDITISGILKDEFGNIIVNKEIIITINGQEYTTTTDNDGKYNYKYTTEMTGLHNIEVIYAGDTTYFPSNDTTYFPSNNKTTFNVRKINTNLSINDINDTTIGQEIEISGVLTDEFGNNVPNATIKIIVNGNQQNTTITDAEGNYKVIINDTLGLNTVFVIYDGNYKYYPSNNQTSFNTTTNTMISINNIDDTTIGSSININGTLKDGEGNTLSNTNIIITINGQEYTVITDNDGKYNYIYTTSTLGENIVGVSFIGNATHKPSNNQTSFNVRKINTNLSIDTIDDTTIGSNITISGILTDEFGNTLPNTSIVIIINGQEYTTTTDNDGKYNYIYTTSTLGENIISVNYHGDNKYSPSSNQTSFKVRKINTNLSINDVNDTTIGQEIEISGVLTDEFGNTLPNTSIVFIINGQEYTTTTDNDGKYNYIYTTSTLGENIVNVNYPGNNKYSPSSNQTSFNVRKINTNLSIDTIDDTTVGRDITVSGVLTDEFGNILANTNITIIVNGNIFKATTDVNGVYNYGYTIDVTGLHRVDVIYSGNTTHFPSNNNTSFNVRKIDTNLSINTINDTTISSNVEVSGTLTDEYENILPNTTITININGQEYTTTTDNNGKYNYTYMVNTLDQNTVIVNYPGDDKYNSATTFTTFNVRKINTKLFINTINDTIVGQDINVGGVLKDEFENILVNTTVEITITNPKGTKNTYTTTTNEEGMYSVTYAGNIDGTYKVEVNYIGNNTYNSSSNETSFNTRKINTKLIIDSIENTTIDTNIFITGKLVDEFGNIVPNTFINITVNNNMIELYVDANGTFTCIYKTSILGENNITLQYNGNDTYNPSSNEASFNVRKLKSTIVVDSIVGYIGENITLTARITDENGKLVNGGNIVFKFNGKTLREDGRFDSTASPMKFKVVDGIVKYITVADAYLRNVKHITATYSGSYNYESSKAEYNHVLLNKRSAQINVTVTPNFTKQNTKIVFNATIKDVTINGTNTSIINNNGKVIFKINGKVVKDEDGNIIFVKVVNNSANYTYYIPNAMASVYNNSVLRNYTVEAVYGNPLYDSDTRNTTIFNVEQSPININVANITINKNTNKLTLKANITDYQENLVVGTNKICLKINDKTLTDESNNTIYYYITDGIIDLSNITVPAINNYHNITIVAGERYAYKSNKITSTDINVVDK